MATKDDRPGLLSKVAKFVRNPTKDWSELDQPDLPQESGYDKQALKAMIERKRQNDFVRKREFDQLRKLRNRDPVAMANMARPSFFQSSVATDQDGRAVTLKKIDEIEAQMSKQWWKGKGEGTTRNTDLSAPRDSRLPRDSRQSGDSQNPGSSQFPTQAPTHSPHHFAPTEAVGLRPTPDSISGELQSTQMPAVRVPMKQSYSAPAVSAEDQTFSSSELFALEVDELTTDPELEEAAIRFANGDDAGAEKGLLEALRGETPSPELGQSWAAALLDLYRATGKKSQFDSAAQEFRAHFGAVNPAWAGVSASVQSAGGSGALIWDSPAVLDLQGMESLRFAMSSNPTPWRLGWARLESITADAVPLLDALFASLCEESVALHFAGADRLVQRLRAMTPSGDRAVDKTWWQVRLNALRSMHLIDEFELAALDFCVTFEVAPPAWLEARCDYAPAEGASSIAEVPKADGPALAGEILGDATPFLDGLAVDAKAGGVLEVSCRNLVRMDFSAAGSTLNWVTLRQAEGVHVQFRDVHRLVAAFFHVIGINEYARVTPRPI
jgi:hypothetical protein